MQEQYTCTWLRGKSLDENAFCQAFLESHPLIYTGGHFYDQMGIITDEGSLRKEIYDILCNHSRTNLAKKVDNIVQALKIVTRQSQLKVDENAIHIANGTFHLYNGYWDNLEICSHRLPVYYTGRKDPAKHWEAFLRDLLEPEDILTLQEFMGYCLLPTNKAQKMLIILGNGGEGKSRIAVAMKAIFGESMHVGSLAKLEGNAFARSDLEDLLVFVDDDLRMDALQSTSNIKSLISADIPMDVERKYMQSYQAKIHARLIAFGNGTLQSLHDRSYGFFRRQIILSAKPRDPNRKDDPYLGEKLVQEREEIFMWCLYGLYRLVEQDYQFTLSQKAKDNWTQTVADQNNVVSFMDSTGYIRFGQERCITAKRLYELYRLWCEDNAVKALSQRSFSAYLINHQHQYGISYTTNVKISEGKTARGFRGIAPHVSL